MMFSQISRLISDPISLTASLSKVLESFVSRWVLDLIDKKLDRKQFGGLRGKSTTHALLI